MHPRQTGRIAVGTALGLLLVAGFSVLTKAKRVEAQVEDTAASTQAPRLAPSSTGKALLDPNDTVVLLLDHQTGLFQTVKDVPIDSTPRTACASR